MQVDRLQKECASKEDLEAVSEALATKAEKAALEYATGGSTAALDGLQLSVQKLEASQSEMASSLEEKALISAVTALASTVESKADAAAVEQLEQRVKSGEEQAAASATELKASVSELYNSKAALADLQALQAQVASKADKSVLDQVTGGSASALTDLQESVAKLEGQQALSADAAKLEELETRMQAAQADAVASTTAEVAKLTTALAGKAETATVEKVVADVSTANKLLESLGAMDSKLEAAEKRLETLSAGGASQTSVDALQQALEKLQGEVPSSSDLARVKSQLETLEGGMAALEGLADLKKSMDSLVGAGGKIAALERGLERSQSDMQQSQSTLKTAQEQQAAADANTAQLVKRLDDLEGMAAELDSVSAQVWCPPVSGGELCCLSRGSVSTVLFAPEVDEGNYIFGVVPVTATAHLEKLQTSRACHACERQQGQAVCAGAQAQHGAGRATRQAAEQAGAGQQRGCHDCSGQFAGV